MDVLLSRVNITLPLNKNRNPQQTWRWGLTAELQKINKTWREAKTAAMDRKKMGKNTAVTLCHLED